MTSAAVFTALWGMMHPDRFCPPALANVEEFALILNGMFGATIWACIAACTVLHLLKLFRSGDLAMLRKYLTTAVLMIGAVFTGVCFCTPLSTFTDMIAGAQNNMDAVFAILRFAASVIPYALNVWVCILIADLLRMLASERSGNTQIAAEKAVNWCCFSLSVTVSLTALMNFLQILFMQKLTSAHTHLDIPAVSIVFTLLILLVCRLLIENQNLRDDNELFI